ncbi:alpha-amylase family glycosyl hydrolase [Dokdonia sp. Hel_I_53]|uniref:alpha-amylase family glycosyl hydrolase n=1 Tax=Dokdonia sp. Hel_I_53 TaxID=1566287 RepID=UPI001198D8F2|nr:glycosidase [Dokdonia sp. Hel_I_53]TVZ51290.1 maltooligosyl trehalose synthase [Dokdonia sp. Hel_I_53]
MSKLEQIIPNGVMLNAYPDSIGATLSDMISVLQKPEMQEAFSLFYILPTFFNSDLDRGFSIIDYNINNTLVSTQDLEDLKELDIMLKFDIVLNHLSVASPQFKDLLKKGSNSPYADFFINWNTFWQNNTATVKDGVAIPPQDMLNKLFMRKPGLPVLKVNFPDGSEPPYWNTFYQKVTYQPISIATLSTITSLTESAKKEAVQLVNKAIKKNEALESIRFRESEPAKNEILDLVRNNCVYLGQMDVNAKSQKVWDFYDETLRKVSGYGCKILRLDAFAYLHKEVGERNFFNTPGTWEYLDRIQKIAKKYELTLLPEIHAEYGVGLHDEVAREGYQIYDFFLPGLLIHTLETSSATALLKWANEIVTKGYKTVNMLGCHDGIPVLDLKGAQQDDSYRAGLLDDNEIENCIETILERGGRVKNIYDPEGNKISYYQVNATYYSALGESDDKLLLARAIQLFMPGIPQIWYLDLFAGKNDYNAADAAGQGGHKEINRTTLSLDQVEQRLEMEVVQKQLEMIKLRNTSVAFNGTFTIEKKANNHFSMSWEHQDAFAMLTVDLKKLSYAITTSKDKTS